MNKTDHSTKPSVAGLRRIVRAFWYSLEGMGSALKHEAAFRQELVLGACLVPVAIILPVGLLGAALMISAILLVLIVELVNSAVEWVVDYISLDKHPFAKRAKDMASAAVFLSLCNGVLVWALVIGHNWTRVARWAGGLTGLA